MRLPYEKHVKYINVIEAKHNSFNITTASVDKTKTTSVDKT